VGNISLLSFVRRGDFGSELIFDELSEYLVIYICFKLILSTLKYSRYKVKCNLAEAFKEQDVLLPIVLQLFIADEVGDTRE